MANKLWSTSRRTRERRTWSTSATVSSVPPSPPQQAIDANVARLDTTPSVTDIVGVTYPERAIRKNDTFLLRVRRARHKDGAQPSQLAVDVKFTVTNVEPTHIELACKGTQKERVQSGKQFARVDLELTCRARIDRRDGRTSRWWIESVGTTDSSGKQPPIRATMHYDVAVGAIDSEVCERAKEP